MQRAHTFVAWCVGKESPHARSSSINHDDRTMNRAAGWIGAMQQANAIMAGCRCLCARVNGTKCWVEIERTCIWPSSFCTFRHHNSTWCTLLEVSHSTSHSQVHPPRTVQHQRPCEADPAILQPHASHLTGLANFSTSAQIANKIVMAAAGPDKADQARLRQIKIKTGILKVAATSPRTAAHSPRTVHSAVSIAVLYGLHTSQLKNTHQSPLHTFVRWAVGAACGRRSQSQPQGKGQPRGAR